MFQNKIEPDFNRCQWNVFFGRIFVHLGSFFFRVTRFRKNWSHSPKQWINAYAKTTQNGRILLPEALGHRIREIFWWCSIWKRKKSSSEILNSSNPGLFEFWAKNRKNREKNFLLRNKPGFDGSKIPERLFVRFQIGHHKKMYRMRCPRASGSKIRPF